MSKSKICDFYNNQTILITGGSGFLGKVLVEKLLRSTNVSKIYLLLREKKGRPVETAVEKIFNIPLFDVLKKQQPFFEKRVIAIQGDCAEKNFGLSENVQEELTSSLNIVFHLAATVRFEENIKVAFDINIKGTRNLLELCKKVCNLKSVVVVSTAFTNCLRADVDEIIYEAPVSSENLENILKNVSSKEAENLTSKLLGNWLNTYVFTKIIAENEVKDKAVDLPVGIFRPAIVTPSYREPIKNWVDSFGGPAVVLAYSMLGLTKNILCTYDCNIEYVPVDMVTAALIAIGWDVYTRKDLPVYNFISSVDNPVKAAFSVECFNFFLQLYPLEQAYWIPKLECVTSLKSYNFFKLWSHYFPAFLLDIKDLLRMRRPKSLHNIRKIDNIFKDIFFFARKNWKFKNDNVRNLWRKMGKDDRKLFPFDVTEIDWVEHLSGFIKGMRSYLFKEPVTNIEKARKKMQKFRLVENIFKSLVYLLVTYSTISILSKISVLILGGDE